MTEFLNSLPRPLLGLFLALAFFTSWATTYLVHKRSQLLGLIDIPNARSAHHIPTPRGGGIGIVVGSTLCVALVAFYYPDVRRVFAAIWLPALAVAGIGLADDRFGLSARIRATVHLLAAFAALFALPLELPVPMALLIFPVAAFGIVWSLNLFNFMDGSDGIAATEAVFMMIVAAFVFHGSDTPALTWACLGIGGSVLGFLWWNWPKAKIFMGDVGSGFLGFVISGLALVGFLRGVSISVWLIAYGLFLGDASITLLRRFLRHENIYAAHNGHAYQRLHHIAKWSHAKILWAAIGANIVLLGDSLVVLYRPEWVVCGEIFALIFLGALFFVVERLAPLQPAK